MTEKPDPSPATAPTFGQQAYLDDAKDHEQIDRDPGEIDRILTAWWAIRDREIPPDEAPQ